MSSHMPDQPEELPQRYTAAELNLSRLPFFASYTKDLESRNGITYTDTVTHDGQEIETVWEVTGNTKYGYPGPFAESVHAALLDIITERGLPFENPVVFSFYEVCQRLDIPPSGKNMQNIRNAILSIRLAGIVIENSFVTSDGRRISYTPDPKFLYKRIALYGDDDPESDETMNISAVWLSDFYLQSLNNGNIRPINFEYFKHLHGRSYAATKIYQYLGYRFSGAFRHDNDYAKVDYDDLTTIADVKRRQYLSQAKQKLRNAHQALLDTDFVDHIEWEKQKRRKEQNKFVIYYYPGRRAREEYQNGQLQLDQQFELPLLGQQDSEDGGEPLKETIPEDSSDEAKTTKVFTHELKKLGITDERAKELDQTYSQERITRQLDHLDYLSERGKSPDNAAAWLVSAIEEDYSTPDGFKTREERKAEKQARAKAAERKRKKEQEEERKRQEEKKRRQQLDERLEALSEDDQQAIEEEIAERIRSDFSDWMRTLYETKEFDPESPMHAGKYYDHLEQILEERDDPE
jgi:hypothetical protein